MCVIKPRNRYKRIFWNNFGISLGGRRQDRSAMRTGIQKTFETAIFLTVHEHGLAAQVGREIIPRILHLAFVAQENPVGLEYRPEFRFENILVEIDIPVDAKNILVRPVVDQVVNLHKVDHSIHLVSPYSAAERLTAGV